jgi:hypothetical protein
MNNMGKWVKFVIRIFCAIGFLGQVIIVSEQYFRYTTTTNVYFGRDKILADYSIAFCVRHHNIIDVEKLRNDTGIIIRPYTDMTGLIEDEQKLTVDQIFEYTPKAEEVIEWCVYRPPPAFNLLTSVDCNSIFNVTKFFTLDSICYNIKEIRTTGLSHSAVALSNYYRFISNTVDFTDRFTRVNHAYVVVYSGTLPYGSRKNSPSVPPFRSGWNANKTTANTMMVVPSDTTVQLLPPPHETKCIDRNSDEINLCRKNCLIRLYKQIHRVPGTELLTFRHKLRPLSTIDLRNETIRRFSDQSMAVCNSECNFDPCVNWITKTSFIQSFWHSTKFSISLNCPADPHTYTRAVPTMSFIEFFSFVAGCFGTWFGVSFLSLESLSLLGRKRIVKEKFIVRFPSTTWVCSSRPA